HNILGNFTFSTIAIKVYEGRCLCSFSFIQVMVIQSCLNQSNWTLRKFLEDISPLIQEASSGSSVNLTCSSDNEEHSEDKGNYCCKSENKHGQSSSFLFISVQCKYSLLYKSLSTPQMLIYMKKYLNICFPDAPKLPSVSGSVSGEGSSVTLTCSSDANPAANYTWYKENEDSPKASGQTFTISDDGHEQSGNYQCKVQNSRGHHSSTLHLVVVQISPEDPGKALYLRLLSFLMCSLHFKPMFTQMLSV
uniref:Ig-like domain-containing protein n=1 Tax=Amphiprion ocellaris TaxID=80972 RepID=A0AAQ5YJZ1_AMPOC